MSQDRGWFPDRVEGTSTGPLVDISTGRGDYIIKATTLETDRCFRFLIMNPHRKVG